MNFIWSIEAITVEWDERDCSSKVWMFIHRSDLDRKLKELIEDRFDQLYDHVDESVLDEYRELKESVTAQYDKFVEIDEIDSDVFRIWHAAFGDDDLYELVVRYQEVE